jgi:hypothetical protein
MATFTGAFCPASTVTDVSPRDTAGVPFRVAPTSARMRTSPAGTSASANEPDAPVTARGACPAALSADTVALINDVYPLRSLRVPDTLPDAASVKVTCEVCPCRTSVDASADCPFPRATSP